MNTSKFKKIVSLLLVVCILAGFLSLMPTVSIRAAADLSTSGNYFLRVGASSGLANGSRKTGLEEPFYHVDDSGNSSVYIPVSTLQTMLGSAPSESAVDDTLNAVKLSNIGAAYSSSGYYGYISNMNLIAITKTQNLFNGQSDDAQVALMKKFLFDSINTSGAQNSVFTSGNAPTVATAHPYLFANQAKFDELHEVWAAGEDGASDKTYFSYVNEQVKAAERLYKQYAAFSGDSYVGLNLNAGLVNGHQDALNKIPYISNGGYDTGGRLSASSTHAGNIRTLAYAYQVTRDQKFSDLAYDYAYALGQWEHWGPGHFLNAADAMGPYATAYDWLYNVWTDTKGEDAVKTIEEMLFTHSVVPAFYGITKDNNVGVWQSSVGGYTWNDRENNWNAVCSAGVTVAALALYNITRTAKDVGIDTAVNGVVNYDKTVSSYGTHTGLTNTYQGYCQYVLDEAVFTLPYRGLGQYVPDGSYKESNGYWDYGTNNIFLMSAALNSAITDNNAVLNEKDFGLLDAWGMDKTIYFALNTMSSDGLGYNYHDSNSTGSISTAWLFYLAKSEGLGDRALAAIRRDILEKNSDRQKPTFWDAIYYWDDTVSADLSYPALSYYMEGIDGFVVRDSWNPQEGSMYAAFMGGSNYFAHSQIDSGSFVYYNKGTRWFCDLGTENYNATGFWDYTGANPNRGKYYVMNAEGNNCLILTKPGDHISTFSPAENDITVAPAVDYSSFFGQYIDLSAEDIPGGIIENTYSDSQYGAYAVINNENVYQVKINYTYNSTSTDSCGDTTTTQVPTTVNHSLVTEAYRGMLSTNSNKTVVIQDEVTFVEEQEFAWIAHMLPTTQVMLSVDGTTAFLSDGETTIRVKLLDPDGRGLKFEVKNQDDRLLDTTIAATPDVTGPNAPNDYTAYKKLVVQGSATSLRMAVVIEEMIPGVTMNDEKGIGYTFTPMLEWSNSTVKADDRTDNEGGSSSAPEETGPVATVEVIKYAKVENPDSPFVDFWGNTAVVTTPTTLNDGEIEEQYSREPLSFSELADIINNAPTGAEVTVYLNRSNDVPIVLNHECTVHRNGNKLLATSATLMAMADGDTVSYEMGQPVTVTFNINGTEYKRTYVSSTVASFNGQIPDGIVYEVDGEIRNYYVYGGWSTRSNDKVMDSNSLIVSSENNYFYIAKTPYEGAFVTVDQSGNIEGHMDGADFFTKSIRETNEYERIDITNDFYFYAEKDAEGVNRTVKVNMNIYLNGRTVTYTADQSSTHMFIPQESGVDLNIYGPGNLNNEARSSNFISGGTSGGATVLIDGVTIHSAYTLIDHRYGYATFRNCDITVENNVPAFAVTNRNNVITLQNATTYPYVLVDGCTINMPTTQNQAIFSITSNSILEVTGGTVIKSSAKVPLFRLVNQNIDTADHANGKEDNTAKDYVFASGCSGMKAIIGEVYYDYSELFVTATANQCPNNTTDDTQYPPTVANIFYGNGYKSTADPSSLNKASADIKVVNSGDSDYPYQLSNKYATVRWTNGTVTVEEFWAEGTIPTPSDTVKSKLGLGSGQMLGYTATEVVAGETYTITTTNMTNIPVKVNMSLQASFQLNFFVLKVDGIEGFAIDGGDMVAASEFDTIVIDGNTYYKVMKSGISPEFAGSDTTLTIYHTTGTLTRAISPIQYVDKALQAGSMNDLTSRQLLVNILKYVDAAYILSGNNVKTLKEYNKVRLTYEKYKQYATVSLVNKQPIDTSNFNHAIQGASLSINEVPNMRFTFVGENCYDNNGNLKPAYSGTVVFTYVNNGVNESKTVVVENGIVVSINGATSGRGIGLGYIDIERKAFDMVNSAVNFTIDGTIEGEYSLANYYYYFAVGDAKMIEFINALYAYCETASNYKTIHPEN